MNCPFINISLQKGGAKTLLHSFCKNYAPQSFSPCAVWLAGWWNLASCDLISCAPEPCGWWWLNHIRLVALPHIENAESCLSRCTKASKVLLHYIHQPSLPSFKTKYWKKCYIAVICVHLTWSATFFCQWPHAESSLDATKNPPWKMIAWNG